MPIPAWRRRQMGTWRDNVKAYHHRPSRPKKKKKLVKKLFLTIVVAAIFLFIFGSIYIAALSRNLPNPNQLMNREVAQSTKIYDRTGEHVLYEISGEQRRTLVPLNEIPDFVKEATIAIEDKNFYKHGGFSVWAMIRSAITDVLFNRRAGGSTLTQQFIKNAVLTPEKSITRKIKEVVLAYRLEKKFSKDQILQLYLNEIPYGSNAYGVEAASQKYFGQDVQNLDLAEAAALAAMTQAPSFYSPYGDNKNALLSRKDYVLELMAEQDYISTDERDAAQKEEIKFQGPETDIVAPHFVMYIKSILAEKYGEKMIEQEGLKIYTTLDLYKQQVAEEVIKERSKDYPQKYNANNAALVAIDPKTGQILAMVGSRDYFDNSIDGQVNVSTRPRQPGSSMKPVVYAALFEKGYTPNTILYDVKTDFSTDPANPYSPNDYDGKEHGPVSIRQALAGSLNIPAVKAIYLADINNVLNLADSLGYSTLYPRNRFGLSLVLGGGEVELLEHTNAYSAFARDGEISSVTGILKVEDKDGKIIEEYQPASKKALDSQIAREINSVLTDNDARAFIFGAQNYLTLGDRPVGAKTGTTNDFHDAWTIGYTPSLVAGVWVGNNDNAAMKGKADGSVLAAPIWHDFMAKVLGDTPIETFKAPDDYLSGKPIIDGQMPTETVAVDKSTGQLATAVTPPELIEDRTINIYHSILYYVDKNDPLGPPPTDPNQDPQFALWEAGVEKWVAENATSSTVILPPGYGENNRPENKPSLKIDSPSANETITTPFLTVNITASAPRGISQTEYYLNNNLWTTKGGAPTPLTKAIDFLPNGYQALKVRVCDDAANCGEASLNFNLLINNNSISNAKNSLLITYPAGSLALNAIDFPLPIKLQISQPARTAKIDVYVQNTKTKAIALVDSLTVFSGNQPEAVWSTPPDSGAYNLYVELYDWNGDTIKSAAIPLLVSGQ